MRYEYTEHPRYGNQLEVHAENEQERHDLEVACEIMNNVAFYAGACTGTTVFAHYSHSSHSSSRKGEEPTGLGFDIIRLPDVEAEELARKNRVADLLVQETRSKQ
jgi:hypothetical protein